MKNLSPYLLITIVVMVIIFSLQHYKLEPFESFSLRFNDINFKLQKKKINQDVVFVAVDEKSVNRFGRWPWSREIIAKGIDNLKEADMVLFDMIFSEPTDAKSDMLLANSIATLQNSVCGFFLRHKSTQKYQEPLIDILDDSSLDGLQTEIAEYKTPSFIVAPYAELNILPIMQSCTLFGSFSTLAENDKLLRSYPIAFYFKDRLFPSLGIQALRLKFDSDIRRENEKRVSLNKTDIDIDAKGFVQLNFYDKEQYKIISFLDVFENKIKPEYFKGKIVIFGITEVGAGDVVSTPVGMMYGPLIHYTFLSNFLEHQLINNKESFTHLLMLLMILLPLILIAFVQNILTRSLVNIGVYLGIFVVVKLLFVTQMFYIDLFYPLLGLLLSALSLEVFAFNRHEQNTQFIKNAFSAYLSADLLEQLLQKPEELTLGGEDRELTILFSDIRGFTSISEAMDAHNLVKLLNDYFTPMTEAVLTHKGMLDKYIGDAVMAFFNAPVSVKEHPKEACLAALTMIEKLDKLNKQLAKDPKIPKNILPLKIGIGINTAKVVVGNIGSQNRFNYTVMGDGVNISSRVEGITKEYGVSILITESTYEALDATFICREIEPVVLKGKERAITLYELMPQTQNAKKIKEQYDKALVNYKKGELKQAEMLFHAILKQDNDAVSHYFLEKIKRGEPWSIHIMQTK